MIIHKIEHHGKTARFHFGLQVEIENKDGRVTLRCIKDNKPVKTTQGANYSEAFEKLKDYIFENIVK